MGGHDERSSGLLQALNRRLIPNFGIPSRGHRRLEHKFLVMIVERLAESAGQLTEVVALLFALCWNWSSFRRGEAACPPVQEVEVTIACAGRSKFPDVRCVRARELHRSLEVAICHGLILQVKVVSLVLLLEGVAIQLDWLIEGYARFAHCLCPSSGSGKHLLHPDSVCE